jgi:hypothetical protein
MPVFDLVAARSTARAMASEGRKDMGARMTREEAMTTTKSERIQERFERARRVNCLKPNESANLLANVALLARDMVANAVDDSGCKWWKVLLEACPTHLEYFWTLQQGCSLSFTYLGQCSGCMRHHFMHWSWFFDGYAFVWTCMDFSKSREVAEL